MILMLHLQSKRSEMSTFRRHCRFALMRVGLFALALISARTGLAEDARWSKEKAWNWYNKVSPIVGCNYLPRTAVNMTEMWQRESFDPTVIDQELGWGRKVGFNSVRVFLPYVVWKDDPKGLKKRIDRFLEIANRHQIRTMLILFCDCAFAGKEPYLGRQAAPVPGVHNSGWVPSPGLTLVTDRNVWPDLEKYVKDIVGTFRQDDRVLIWDLYNEPGNSNMELKSLPLVEATFAWARQVAPQQPLTVGAWSNRTDGMPERLVELSDVVSFHAYNRPADMKKKVAPAPHRKRKRQKDEARALASDSESSSESQTLFRDAPGSKFHRNEIQILATKAPGKLLQAGLAKVFEYLHPAAG